MIRHAPSLAWRGNHRCTGSLLLVSLRAISHKVSRFATLITPRSDWHFTVSGQVWTPTFESFAAKRFTRARSSINLPWSCIDSWLCCHSHFHNTLRAVSTLAVEISSLIFRVFTLANCCRTIVILSGKPLTKVSFTIWSWPLSSNPANSACFRIFKAYTSTATPAYLIILSFAYTEKVPSINAVFNFAPILSASNWYSSLNWRYEAKAIPSKDRGIKLAKVRDLLQLCDQLYFRIQAIKSSTPSNEFTILLPKRAFPSILFHIHNYPSDAWCNDAVF